MADLENLPSREGNSRLVVTRRTCRGALDRFQELDGSFWGRCPVVTVGAEEEVWLHELVSSACGEVGLSVSTRGMEYGIY